MSFFHFLADSQLSSHGNTEILSFKGGMAKLTNSFTALQAVSVNFALFCQKASTHLTPKLKLVMTDEMKSIL